MRHEQTDIEICRIPDAASVRRGRRSGREVRQKRRVRLRNGKTGGDGESIQRARSRFAVVLPVVAVVLFRQLFRDIRQLSRL